VFGVAYRGGQMLVAGIPLAFCHIVATHAKAGAGEQVIGVPGDNDENSPVGNPPGDPYQKKD
jgi:hypothetical protein